LEAVEVQGGTGEKNEITSRLMEELHNSTRLEGDEVNGVAREVPKRLCHS